jgi:hypothetical protein
MKPAEVGKVLRRQLPAAAGRTGVCVRLQFGRKVAAEAQADASLAGVVEEELAERTLEAAASACLPSGRADLGEGEFDVLAGAEVVGREIGARAAVVAGLRAADDDPVAAPAVGVEDRELGKDRVVAEILEAERLLAAELTAQRALPVVGRQVAGLRWRERVVGEPHAERDALAYQVDFEHLDPTTSPALTTLRGSLTKRRRSPRYAPGRPDARRCRRRRRSWRRW